MVERMLFDTNILIDYLRGMAAAQREIGDASEGAISIVSWMEVMVGTRPENEAETRLFLSSFTNLPVTAETAERAVALRRRRSMKLPDALILASAQLGGYLLCTRNTRDFPAEEAGVRIPYRV